MTPVLLSRVLGILFTLVPATVLYRRWARGTFFSGTSGLHASVLLYYGLGTIAYSFTGQVPSRVSLEQALSAFGVAGPLLLAGYLIASLPDLLQRPQARGRMMSQLSQLLADQRALPLLWLLTVLAAIGYVGSTNEYSTSGFGTIFPVLKMFQYPLLIVAVCRYRKRDWASLLLLTVNMSASLYFMFYSPWRSEVIMATGAIALGLVLRRAVWIGPALVLGAVAVLLGLPYAQLKKSNYEEVMADPLSAMRSIGSLSIAERLQASVEFWSFRVNGARELAYVQNALDDGFIMLRHGETYIEALKGLMPRVLWPDKPAFNLETNYMLPRAIGLLGNEDYTTSWGVNTYAECVWNFGARSLIWSVPLWFLLVHGLDKLQRRYMLNATVREAMSVVIFFQFVTLVSVVNALTYLMWSLIFAKAIELYFRSTARRGARLSVLPA